MEIATERLILRDFTENDFEGMMAYRFDPRYLRFYTREWAEREPEDVRRFLQSFIADQREQPRTKFQLAVTLKEGDNRLIGNVGVRMPEAGSPEGDIGCELAPDYWRLGFATEATRAIMSFGFEQLRLHRLSAQTIAANSGAWSVLEKVGMTREGELRETTLLGGVWANSFIYGMLEHEWRRRQSGPELKAE